MLTVLFTVIYFYIFLKIIGLLHKCITVIPGMDIIAGVFAVIALFASIWLARLTVGKLKTEK